ncbi:MAG: hypothetical protein U0103_16630 [Candidatus Obscuribacterales bacterium]
MISLSIAPTLAAASNLQTVSFYGLIVFDIIIAIGLLLMSKHNFANNKPLAIRLACLGLVSLGIAAEFWIISISMGLALMFAIIGCALLGYFLSD